VYKHFEWILCFVDRASLYNLVNLHSTLHTRQSTTKSDKYQVSHRYSYFSWWWACNHPKHIQKRNKHKKNLATNWLYLQDFEWIILDFKPSSCSEYRILSFGWFPSIWTSHRHIKFWCRGINQKKNVTLRVNLFSTFPWLDHPTVNLMNSTHMQLLFLQILHFPSISSLSVRNILHSRTATYRCDDTRCCVMQFWPLDDEHTCSKHVEAWNKTYCETNLCIKLVKYWDKYTEMHSQQNVKTVTCVTLNYMDEGHLRISLKNSGDYLFHKTKNIIQSKHS